MPDLFDIDLRAMRRDRAFRTGAEPFVHNRAFADILERIGLVRRGFDDALIIGCPDPGWPKRLADSAARVEVVDPGPLFAASADGRAAVEDALGLAPQAFDLIVAVGTLDTVNRLPEALRDVRLALRPGGLLIGAVAGGNTLPLLRAAMRAADEAVGSASPHVHPRIEPAALARLLGQAGYVDPVIDVDRLEVRYAHLRRLVADLRGMAATNILADRSKIGLPRRALAAAEHKFAEFAVNGRSSETIEILNFSAWAAT